MKKHLSKKRVVLAAIIVVALAIASGVAYAYFSSSGSNTGTAGVGSSQNLAVAQSGTVPSNLVPGGAAQNVQVTVTNNATFKQSLSALTISLDDTQLPAGCSKDWFTVTSPNIASPIVLNASGGSTNLTGTIQMTESNSLQDNCRNATLHLNFVAS